MLRRFFCAGVAMLLVVGLTPAAEKKSDKEAGQRAFGKVVSLDVKDGAGTLTIMGKKSRDDQPAEMKFKITKDTQFTEGGGRGKEGTAVEAGKVADKFTKDQTVRVSYEGAGSDLTAKKVSAVTPRPRPENK